MVFALCNVRTCIGLCLDPQRWISILSSPTANLSEKVILRVHIPVVKKSFKVRSQEAAQLGPKGHNTQSHKNPKTFTTHQPTRIQG